MTNAAATQPEGDRPMTTATATRPDTARPRNRRQPYRLAQLEGRWACSRMSVWRVRQDPRFPEKFKIGGLNYV